MPAFKSTQAFHWACQSVSSQTDLGDVDFNMIQTQWAIGLGLKRIKGWNSKRSGKIQQCFFPLAGSSDLPLRYTKLNRLRHGWCLSPCSLVYFTTGGWDSQRTLNCLRKNSAQMFLFALMQPSDFRNIFNFLLGETPGPLQAPRLEKSKQRGRCLYC